MRLSVCVRVKRTYAFNSTRSKEHIFEKVPKVKGTCFLNPLQVKGTPVRNYSKVKKNWKLAKLCAVENQFGNPLIKNWDFANIMRKILFDETNDSYCIEYRIRKTGLRVCLSWMKDQKSQDFILVKSTDFLLLFQLNSLIA